MRETAYFPIRGGRSQLDNITASMEQTIARWNRRLDNHEVQERAHRMCRESGVRISERDAIVFEAERRMLETAMLDEVRAIGRWAGRRGIRLRGL